MENETRDLYFNKLYDSETNTYFLSLKNTIKSYNDLPNKELKEKLKTILNNDDKGMFVKGFRLCFKYQNELYYIIHEHQTNDFIHKITECLKYYCATDILIKYGEID